MPPRPRRSALYMPASNARALDKARTLDADVVIIDLEDAVAPEAKQTAREQAVAAVLKGGYGEREVVIRINGLDTAWGEEDLRAAAAAGPDAILVPKLSRAAQLTGLAARLAGAPDRVRLWAMIETPLAILDLREIAAAGAENNSRLACLVLGTNDLAKETGAELDPERTAALFWLSKTVTAARAFGLTALDGVYNDYKDAEGLRRECRQARLMGMDGKTLVHPDQLADANRIFAPSAAEMAWSRKVVAAFERPENAGRGVIGIDGRMVEIMHLDAARRTLAMAAAIAARSGSATAVG